MRIILDHSKPKPLMRHLPNHECRTARQMQWEKLQNGELLKISEEVGFDITITCDRNLRYQQNLKTECGGGWSFQNIWIRMP